MTIVFEGYTGGTTLDGTVTARPKLRSLVSDITGGFFDSHIQDAVVFNGDAPIGDGQFSSLLPVDARFWPNSDGVFTAKLPIAADFSGSDLAPGIAVFSSFLLPPFTNMSSFSTQDGSFQSHPPVSSRFAPSNLFASKLTPLVYFSDGLSPMDKSGFLLQQPVIYGTAHEGYTIVITQNIGIGTEADILKQVWVLLDTIALGDSAPTVKELIKILSDKIGLFTLLRYSQRLILTDQVKLGAVTYQSAVQLLALMETIRITAGPDWTAEIQKTMAVLLALADKADASTFVSLSETIRVLSTQTVDITYYEKLVAAVAVSLTAVTSLVITAVLKDSLVIGDVPTQITEMLQILRDSIGATVVLSTGDEAYTAWVMDAESKAVWRYDNYPFNSFAQLGDTFLGALPDGIYRLTGDDDAGEPIAWNVRTGLLNFGTQLEKHIDVAYIGYTADGTVGLSVYTTNPAGEKIQYNYVMVGRTANATRENRISVGRGLESVYWAFELAGTENFTLSDWQILPMVAKGGLPLPAQRTGNGIS